jgi:uncharacterized phage infection (PIP) family protein YhgE
MGKDRLDEIERILKEIVKEQRKNTNAIAKLQRAQNKTDEQLRKTDEQLEKLTERQNKTDEQLRKTDEQLRKTDEKIKELAEQQKKTDKQIDKVARDIGGGLGRAAEGLTAPCVAKLFKDLGFEISEVQQRVKSLDPVTKEVKAEVDLLCPGVLNGKEVVLIGEVKANLTSDDIKYFLEDVVVNFKIDYPKYKNLDVFTFVSGLNISKDVEKFAYRRGLYVLAPAGETMRILNPPQFKPKIW